MNEEAAQRAASKIDSKSSRGISRLEKEYGLQRVEMSSWTGWSGEASLDMPQVYNIAREEPPCETAGGFNDRR